MTALYWAPLVADAGDDGDAGDVEAYDKAFDWIAKPLKDRLTQLKAWTPKKGGK